MLESIFRFAFMKNAPEQPSDKQVRFYPATARASRCPHELAFVLEAFFATFFLTLWKLLFQTLLAASFPALLTSNLYEFSHVAIVLAQAF